MIGNWIIAGASGGLGGAIARELANRRCKLSLLASPASAEVLRENAHDLEIRSGHAVKWATFDAEKPETCSAELEKAGFGGEPFGVIWAVGVMPSQRELEADPLRAARAHLVNYTAALVFLELAAARMWENGAGHVVALGSPAGDRGRKSNYLYGASKAALHAHLEGMRHRFAGSGIRVTTVKPGPTRTAMTLGMKQPLQAEPEAQARRIVRAIELGKAVVYTPPVWRLILLVIRHLPRPVYDRLDL